MLSDVIMFLEWSVGESLTVGDIVWGRVYGFPLWPGKIVPSTEATRSLHSWTLPSGRKKRQAGEQATSQCPMRGREAKERGAGPPGWWLADGAGGELNAARCSAQVDS